MSAQKSGIAKAPQQSFLDTLTNAANVPVSNSGSGLAGVQPRSGGNSNQGDVKQPQSTKDGAVQSNAQGTIADQVQSTAKNVQAAQAALPQIQDKPAIAASDKKPDVRTVDKSSAKKLAFTGEVTVPFVLQSSTVQPEVGKAVLVPVSTSIQDSSAVAGNQALQAASGQAIDAASTPAIGAVTSRIAVASNTPLVGTANIQPVETTNSTPVEAPNTKPVETPSTKLVDATSMQPVATPILKPVATLNAQPIEVSNAQPSVSPNAKPVEQRFTLPINTPNTKSLDSTNTQPVDIPSSKPVDTTSTQSADVTNIQPANAENAQVANVAGAQISGPQAVSIIPAFAMPTISQDSQAGQGSDAGQTVATVNAVRTVAAQVAASAFAQDRTSSADGTGNGEVRQPASAAQPAAISVVNGASLIPEKLVAQQLASSPVPAASGNKNQPAPKTVQPSGSTFAQAASTSSDGADKTQKSDDSRSAQTAAHSTPLDSLQVLAAQAGNAQAVSADGKAGNASQLQPVAIATQTELRSSAGVHATSIAAETTAYSGPRTDALSADQAKGSDIAGMSGISAARLIQSIGSTEMRVGMNSAEFGEVSIRTSVAQQQMQTQISVNHGELGSALATHIPNLQAKLGSDYGLHATIEVNQGGASFSSDGDQSRQQHQSSARRAVAMVDGPAAAQTDAVSLPGQMFASSSARLDIQA